MNYTKSIFFLMFLIIASFIVYAGDKKGNGGEVVVCPGEVQLLDFFEANIDLEVEEKDEIKIANAILSKLEHFSPKRFSDYKKNLSHFLSEVKFVDETEIGPISDSGPITRTIPINCHLAQIVIQKKIVFGNEKRYLINQSLWNQLSSIHRAGLILHELIYRELQSEDSHSIRIFNSWLFSSIDQEIDPGLFYTKFKRGGFKWVDLYGFPMNVENLIIDDRPIRSLSTYAGVNFTFLSFSLQSKEHFIDSYSNGHPKVIQYFGEMSWQTNLYEVSICQKKDNCKIGLDSLGGNYLLNNSELINKITGEKLQSKIIKINSSGEVDEIL
jgi:hypothetical protein